MWIAGRNPVSHTASTVTSPGAASAITPSGSVVGGASVSGFGAGAIVGNGPVGSGKVDSGTVSATVESGVVSVTVDSGVVSTTVDSGVESLRPRWWGAARPRRRTSRVRPRGRQGASSRPGRCRPVPRSRPRDAGAAIAATMPTMHRIASRPARPRTAFIDAPRPAAAGSTAVPIPPRNGSCGRHTVVGRSPDCFGLEGIDRAMRDGAGSRCREGRTYARGLWGSRCSRRARRAAHGDRCRPRRRRSTTTRWPRSAPAWLEHHVLAFPDQPMTDDDLERFTLAFGPFGDDPFIAPIPGREHIIAIRRAADETSPLFAENWHTDWSFQERPPAGTCLYGITIPPHGGDTLYANQHAALDAMPADLRAASRAGSRSTPPAAATRPSGLYGEADRAAGRSMDIRPSEDAQATQLHPIIRQHPETGRPGMFGCIGYIIGIDGMPDDEVRRAALRPVPVADPRRVRVPPRVGTGDARDVGQPLGAAQGDRRLRRPRPAAPPHHDRRPLTVSRPASGSRHTNP